MAGARRKTHVRRWSLVALDNAGQGEGCHGARIVEAGIDLSTLCLRSCSR